MKTAINLAYDIIELHEENMELRMQLEEAMHYKEEYEKLLNTSLRHGEKMMGGFMQLLMKPGVCEALAKKDENAVE